MKQTNRIIGAASFGLVLLGLGCVSKPGEGTSRFPEVERSVLARQSLKDFRLLYSSEDALRERVAQDVCVVKVQGSSARREMEVDVGRGIRIEEFLEEKGGFWQQARLVLVKERVIFQRPELGGQRDTEEAKLQFSEMIIEPGDLLYMNLIQ